MGTLLNLIPSKFHLIYKEYKSKSFTYLDIGCGNHSATITKRWFPNCEYHGVDRNNYNNDEQDFNLMKKFYQLDLATSHLEEIPNNYFDVIMCAHVIEHLPNGDVLLKNLSKKLKKNGVMYVEFPGEASIKQPLKIKGTSFYDDDTHVRAFKLDEVSNALVESGLMVQKKGIRRDLKMIFLLPVLIAANLIRGRSIGVLFWDLVGFCEYVFVKRTA